VNKCIALLSLKYILAYFQELIIVILFKNKVIKEKMLNIVITTFSRASKFFYFFIN